MIKNILVHIPTERPMRPVIDGSVSLAKDFSAHVDAIAALVRCSGAFHGSDAIHCHHTRYPALAYSPPPRLCT